MLETSEGKTLLNVKVEWSYLVSSTPRDNVLRKHVPLSNTAHIEETNEITLDSIY